MTSNVRGVVVYIERTRLSSGASVVTLNQVDDESLRAACTYNEENFARQYRSGFTPETDLELAHQSWEAKGIPVWSDATYHRSAAENAQVVLDITERAESNGMLSSGFLETVGARVLNYRRDAWGRENREVGNTTMAQCSTTVRHPKGVGSGWAGASSFDLPRIDLAKLGEVAFDKCLRSIDPVRIEPGRYQTILEPQAVASFATHLFNELNRELQERPGLPLYLAYDSAIERHRSKLGLQLMDRRLNITHDPDDPITGTHPERGMRKLEVVKDGVLTSMFTEYGDYALPEQTSPYYNSQRRSFVMRGTETTTVDEMISTMKRGLLVTRVSDMMELDRGSMLCTGFTRDGLWLIENGKITKAVRNFRWTESPLFVFNNVESVGEAVPVMNTFYDKWLFAGGLRNSAPSVVVPTLKINDFSFTSTIDAI